MKIQKTTEAQRLAVDSFRAFLASEVTPVARAFRGGPIPRERMREITQGIAEFGLPGASIAPVQGGMGLSVVTEAMLLEELCAVSSEVAHCVISNMLVASVLVDLPAALEPLRERYLPDLLTGRSCGGFYLQQADALAMAAEGGVSAWSTSGGWIINGAHERVCNGLYADILIVEVHTEDGALRHVLVTREQHGYTSRIIDRPTLSGTFHTQVSFRNVRLPVGQSIWEGQDGLQGRTRLQEKMDAGMASLSVGLIRTVLEAYIVAVKNTDGPEKPAASQPLVALRIAEMATRLDAARLMCFRAWSLIDAGTDCRIQAGMARWLASETALKACQDALQLPGGKALSAALDLERLVREAIVLPVPHGLTDLQKLSIAESLTGISALD
ncbi:acyl-CoA dehydrogenase family protein [Pseudomonas izuensis]|uniref:Acyl-CoA dehydrogenase n=1 Tax=Pseudomonas izuensis TaxID=2684212 RepID=A0ABM7RS07_9PSED|nr:acyl-CoA dehydrogenase family protein [Pseudomonas izuensis]BCX68196.1 acyl-CoA dehydrogenase [Pseudomonas izuensis]